MNFDLSMLLQVEEVFERYLAIFAYVYAYENDRKRRRRKRRRRRRRHDMCSLRPLNEYSTKNELKSFFYIVIFIYLFAGLL
jgi:hypothetical protein